MPEMICRKRCAPVKWCGYRGLVFPRMEQEEAVEGALLIGSFLARQEKRGGRQP